LDSSFGYEVKFCFAVGYLQLHVDQTGNFLVLELLTVTLGIYYGSGSVQVTVPVPVPYLVLDHKRRSKKNVVKNFAFLMLM